MCQLSWLRFVSEMRGREWRRTSTRPHTRVPQTHHAVASTQRLPTAQPVRTSEETVPTSSLIIVVVVVVVKQSSASTRRSLCARRVSERQHANDAQRQLCQDLVHSQQRCGCVAGRLSCGVCWRRRSVWLWRFWTVASGATWSRSKSWFFFLFDDVCDFLFLFHCLW